jgi:predicted Zn-dependent protease
MFRTFLASTAIACSLALGIATGTFAQTDDSTKAKQEAKDAGRDAADAAKHAGKATKHAAKKTAQVTEDAAKETAEGTKKAAKKVKNAVTPNTTSATCQDGTVHTGKTKTTACVDHGGVRH